MEFVPPLDIRKLRAQKELKNLSLREVSEASGVGYANCSLILGGRLNDPVKLAAIRRVIRKAPMPELEAA